MHAYTHTHTCVYSRVHGGSRNRDNHDATKLLHAHPSELEPVPSIIQAELPRTPAPARPQPPVVRHRQRVHTAAGRHHHRHAREVHCWHRRRHQPLVFISVSKLTPRPIPPAVQAPARRQGYRVEAARRNKRDFVATEPPELHLSRQ